MCGIIGYIGKNNNAIDTLYSGLIKLEYRGYDSCGAAIFTSNNSIIHWNHLGAPSEVSDLPELDSNCGIAHTRWATHGDVSLKNAHPHSSKNKNLHLVHNGVIENCDQIKIELSKYDYSFYSETDTEILANLINFYYEQNNTPLDSVKKALNKIEGTYGLAIIFKEEPNKIYIAKRSSPLIVGVSNNEYYVASDTNALPPNIDKVCYLDDGDIASISDEEGFVIHNTNKQIKFQDAQINSEDINLNNYSCYLEKEIFEQANAIRNTTSGRIKDSVIFGGLNFNKKINRVLFLGCGTAYYAGLLGKYYIENIAKIPASVEISSEYRYKNNPTEEGTLVVAITQSGETIDTLHALKEAQNKGLDTIAITNTVMSSIARQVPQGIYQRIGAEISVASTKAFTSQITLLLMLSIYLGERNNLSKLEIRKYIGQIKLLPSLIEKTLNNSSQIKELSEKYNNYDINFLGRQYMYPIALEGALKLKELAYINTSAYSSGEIKHGPIASVNENFLCVFIAPEENLLDKNILTMKEVKSRGGKILLISREGYSIPDDCYDDLIELPKAEDFTLSILAVIPLQLFAMNIAKLKGFNVDKPRNLAKSVTVE